MIVTLHDHPHYTDVCAAWSYAQWCCLCDGMSLASQQDFFKDSAADAGLPYTVLYLHDEKPVGMAVLKYNEHPDREDLSPWLGSVYVHPDYRRRGFAAELCDYIGGVAKDHFQCDALYLQTHIAPYYTRMGWQSIGTVSDTLGLYPHDNSLMSKTL